VLEWDLLQISAVPMYVILGGAGRKDTHGRGYGWDRKPFLKIHYS
jgi:hypothetical protein